MNIYIFSLCSAPSPIVGSNSAHLLPSGGDLPINICNDSLTIESYGFSHRCAETNILERDSRKSQMLLDLGIGVKDAKRMMMSAVKQFTVTSQPIPCFGAILKLELEYI